MQIVTKDEVMCEAELTGIPDHIRTKLIDMKLKLDSIESIVNKMDSKKEDDLNQSLTTSAYTSKVFSLTRLPLLFISPC